MLNLALNNLDIRNIYIHLETGNILLHFTAHFCRFVQDISSGRNNQSCLLEQRNELHR